MSTPHRTIVTPGLSGVVRLIALGTAWFLILECATAFAESGEPSLDYTEFGLEELVDMDVVYGASKYEQKVSEAPSAVTVVSAEEIQQFGYRTLGEIVASAQGFFETDDRNYGHVGVRGFNRPGDYDSRLLVLIDGIRYNDNIYGSGSMGTSFPVDPSLIRRVEIIRGPSSSLYGSNAFFGVVNVVTKSAADLERLQVAGYAASHEAFAGQASYGWVTDEGQELLVAGSYHDAKGQDLYFAEFDAPETNNGVFADGDFSSVQSLFAKARYGRATVQATYGNRLKGIPTASYESMFNDSRAETLDQFLFVDLLVEGNPNPRSRVVGRINYNRYYYEGRYPYDATEEGEPPTSILFEEIARGQWFGAELRGSSRLGRLGQLTVGTEWRHSFEMHQRGWDRDPFYLYQDDDRSDDTWGTFVQNELPIWDQLRLNLGVRHDHYGTFGGTTNPRAALIAAARPSTTFKLLYGTAFRAPNAYELYYEDGGLSQVSNPDLEPEKVATYEVVWEEAFGPRLRASVATFLYEVEGLINQSPTADPDVFQFVNLGRIDTKGLELEIDGRMLSTVRGRVGYSYQYSHDPESGAELTNSPRHMAKVQLLTPLRSPQLTAGVEFRYLGSRLALDGSRVDDYIVTNLTLLSRRAQGLEISATLYNVFDTEYADPGGEEHEQTALARDGRTFRFVMSYAY